MKNSDDLLHIADRSVLRDIQQFHSRQRVTSIPEVFSNLVSPGYVPEFNSTCEFQEFSYVPLHGEMVPLAPTSEVPRPLKRRGSVREFRNEPISFSTLSSLLRWAKCSTDEKGHRPYPSGGGLFPIETFVVPLRNDGIEGLESASYRVLPNSKQLERVSNLDPAEFSSALFRPPLVLDRKPPLALVYAASFERVVPKYRHRGYRTALIEAGAIIQQMDLCAQALGLATVPWAWFDEYELSKMLGLNPVRLPLVLLQLVGYAES